MFGVGPVSLPPQDTVRPCQPAAPPRCSGALGRLRGVSGAERRAEGGRKGGQMGGRSPTCRDCLHRAGSLLPRETGRTGRPARGGRGRGRARGSRGQQALSGSEVGAKPRQILQIALSGGTLRGGAGTPRPFEESGLCCDPFTLAFLRLMGCLDLAPLREQAGLSNLGPCHRPVGLVQYKSKILRESLGSAGHPTHLSSPISVWSCGWMPFAHNW